MDRRKENDSMAFILNVTYAMKPGLRAEFLREVSEHGIQKAVLAALDGDKPVYGVLQQADSEFLGRGAALPRVRVVTVTEENRDRLRQQLRRADHPEGWLFVDQNGRGVLCRQCPLGAIGHPDALCPRCCTELIHDLHWVFLPCLFYSAPIVTRFCSAEKRLCPLEQTVDPCRFHFSRLCDILL